jgi:hypothetical protein
MRPSRASRLLRRRVAGLVLFAAVASTLIPLTAAAATTHVWQGGGGNDNWSTPGNWVGGAVPVPGASLLFPAGAASFTPYDNMGIRIHGIEFDASGYFLSGTGMVLAGPLTTGAGLAAGQAGNNPALTLSGALDVKVGAGVTLQLTPPAGTGHFVKNGAGTLYIPAPGLGGTATDSAPTLINAGTVQIDAGNSLGSATNPGGIVIAAGARILFGDGNGRSGCVFLQQALTVAGRGPTGTGALSGCVDVMGAVVLSGDATFDSGITPGGDYLIGSTLALGTHSLTLSGGPDSLTDLVSGSGNLIHRTLMDILTANNTYTGVTQLETGYLEINGAQPSSPVRSSGTSTLLGDGTIGPLVASGTAIVRPGHQGDNNDPVGPTPTVLNVQGSATLRVGTTLLTCISNGIEVSPCYADFPAGDAGELSATGRVTLSGALLKITNQTVDQIGTVFTVASAGAGITGHFANAAEGAIITAQNGTHYAVNYHATSVTITRVA